ncbi:MULTISPECIES: flagellar motor switch protein FliN [unclassified Lentilitoribacter]|jgi:flagellar motor switch protein FliN/FliY|uniref:flagellar motor switch protein FliN n=1 Tax=unclassified Lentilitoribacter TaxID=2647570 RepID=UPI0013A6B456|nr:flagellar motor switch protein FliN [Lentilitoribacter sp. Alg239-R112]
MSTENAEENELNIDSADSAELDDAIDGLRDVLKQDSEGLDLSSSEASAEPDLGADLMGDLDSDFGGDIGGDFAAGGDLGSDFGDIGGDLAAGGGLDGGLDGSLGNDLGGDFGGAGDIGSDFGGDLSGGLNTGDAPLGDFGGGTSVTGATGSQTRADLVLDIPIEVQVVLGTSRLQVSELMDLTEGATIGLERKIGEPVEIMVNGKLIGRGEITVLENDDTKFGVKMIEVIGSKPKSG